MRIIHLSDFHYSKSSREKINNIYGKELIIDLKNINKNQNINFILITGDILYQGGKSFKNNNGYTIFKNEFVDILTKELEFNKNNIFFVPGNHDVVENSEDRSVIKRLKKRINTEDVVNDILNNKTNPNYQKVNNILLKRLNKYKRFEKIFYEESEFNKLNKLESYFIRECNEFKIGFICLNSAWSCLSVKRKKINNQIFFGTKQFDKAYLFFQENKCNLIIALIHHPIELVSEFEQRTIINVLQNHCNILLMGHSHTQVTTKYDGVENNVLYCRTKEISGSDFEVKDNIRPGYAVIDIKNNNNNFIVKREFRYYNYSDNFVKDNTITSTPINLIKKDINTFNNFKKRDIIINHFEPVNINKKAKYSLYIKINRIQNRNSIYFAKYPVTVLLYNNFLKYLDPTKHVDIKYSKYRIEDFREFLKNKSENKNKRFLEYIGQTPDWHKLMESKLPQNSKYKDFFKNKKPIVGITQFDAKAYCLWLTFLHSKDNTKYKFRLPTLEEWNQAAYNNHNEMHPELNLKIETIDSYYFHINHPERYSKYGGDPEGPIEVDEKDKFTKNLSQMGGNIFEWLDDCDYDSARPKLKGGAWYSTEFDLKEDSFWFAPIPTWWDYGVGFRIVLEIESK